MRPKIRCDGESWKILQNEVQLNRLLGAVRWSEATSQPAGSLSRVTVHQTSRTVFFSHNKPAGIVFFSQVLDQRTGP